MLAISRYFRQQSAFCAGDSTLVMQLFKLKAGVGVGEGDGPRGPLGAWPLPGDAAVACAAIARAQAARKPSFVTAAITR
jgi:hypothetical protein